MRGNLFRRSREKERWNLSHRLGALPRQQLVTLSVAGKKTRAISQRMWKLCNAFWKRRRKNCTRLSWIQKALMEKLRGRHGIRIPRLRSKLFSAVPTFQLMD